ncbi:MAG: SDR family NAD(P)-dependent oxidoreductase [Symbiobacteriia bacterium]
MVVTGAGNGIGLHMTRALLQDGYRVATCDLTGDNLHDLEATNPERLLYVPCDVTADEQVAAFISEVLRRWGRIDILVNNACLALFRSFEEASLEDTRREFEVNYFGYLRMIRAVLPQMKAQGGGIIHNVSSGVGVTGFAGIHGYASTKGAIEALSRTLAQELSGYGICVNLMQPPLTRTRSAAPLGVPEQIMADPAKVGRGLAKRILSTRPDVTPDLQGSFFLRLERLYPDGVGRLLQRATQRARTEA